MVFLALSSVPNLGTVRPLKPTTKSQEQGQVRVMNVVRNTSFRRMDGNSQICQKENVCIKGHTSQVELRYRGRGGPPHATIHVCVVCLQTITKMMAVMITAQMHSPLNHLFKRHDNSKYETLREPGSLSPLTLFSFNTVLVVPVFHPSTQTWGSVCWHPKKQHAGISVGIVESVD